MTTMTGSQLLEQLNWRYAVKKFDATKKISSADWKTLEQALLLTPSSYGLQPWKFLIVQTPELRKKLTPLSWGQTQVEDCSHFVVMTHAKKMTEAYVQKYTSQTEALRGMPAGALNGYRDMMVNDVVKGPRSQNASVWSAKQAYIAMGNLMTCAAVLGIDTCPMEGLDPAGYDKVLGLEGSEYQTVMAVACGYRSPEDAYSKLKKSRFPIADVIQTL